MSEDYGKKSNPGLKTIDDISYFANKKSA